MPSEEHEQLQKTLAVIDGVLDHFPSGYLLGKTSQRDHDARLPGRREGAFLT